MASLSVIEKHKFEKLFGMRSGYVLDFSNNTFQDFIVSSVNINIYDKKYDHYSGSKANRLRAFWDKEANYVVGKLLSDFLEYLKTIRSIIDPTEKILYDECIKITERLKQDKSIVNIEAIQPYSESKEFEILSNIIKESIDRGEPELALDRLHTFVVKYVRSLCERHGIAPDSGKPLHSIFGEYLRKLKEQNYIETRMTERILLSSIKILEEFNSVRNNLSFAHDNTLLNRDESILIFDYITSLIRFIESIENQPSLNNTIKEENIPTWDDIPF